MATVSKPYTFSAGDKIVSSQMNSNLDTLYNDYNGNITNVNCSATMALADTKLAQITTAGKVSATAFTETSQSAGVVLGHDGTNWTSISASTQRYKVLMSMGSASAARFEKINLASGHSITGELPVANISQDARPGGWVQFDGVGDSPSVKDSYNVSSVVHNGTGLKRIIWDTAFANSLYAVVATCRTKTLADPQFNATVASVTAASVTIATYDGGSQADCPLISVVAFGELA